MRYAQINGRTSWYGQLYFHPPVVIMATFVDIMNVELLGWLDQHCWLVDTRHDRVLLCR
jgi:hypothetical protein